MSKKLFRQPFLVLVLLGVQLMMTRQVAALGEATGLVLPGGRISDFAEGGNFVFAATRGPRGIYVTSDFGTTWNFAAGGDYSVGSGSHVVANSQFVAANLGRKVYLATLGSLSAASSDYTPDWSEIALSLDSSQFNRPEVPKALAITDTFLFVATTYGNIKVIRLSDKSLVATSQIAQLTQVVAAPSLAVDTANSRLLVQLGAADRGNARIFRSTFTVDGEISTWGEATPGGNQGDGGCGGSDYPGSSTSSPVNNGRFGGVHAAPDGTLYLTTQSGPLLQRGIYRSTSGGNCWRKVVNILDAGRLNSLDIRSAAFSGDVHLIGRYLSTNGNANNNNVVFTEIPNSVVPLNAGLDSVAVLLSTNSACGASVGNICAMASSPFGAIVTTDIEAGASSSWAERQSGMRGLLASSIDQSLLNPDIAVLGLAGGIARSINFSLSADKTTAPSVQFERFVPQDGNGVSLPEPVFAVAMDPTDADIAYVGNNRLLRAVFDSNGQPTWTLINDNIAQGKAVRDIIVSSTKIYVVYAQVTDGLGGELRVYDRTTLAPQLTEGLEGKPINSIAVASYKGNEVIYAGVGGIRTRESGGSDATNRGLFRSSDGGVNFTKVESDSFISSAAIASMTYDKRNDILYVAANDTAASDEFESGTDDSEGAEDSGSGRLYIINKASTSKFSLTQPTKGFPADLPVSAVIIADKDGSQKVFAAVQGKIYQSNSKGDTWALFYEGLTDQTVRALIYDDLVTSGSAGLESVTGNPNLVVSTKSTQVKAGTSNKIQITFSKEFLNNSSNRNKVTATIGNIKAVTAKRNALAVSLSPGNSRWPSNSSKIKVRVKSGFKAQDGEGLDSDYDETVDGKTFSFMVKIKK